MNKQLDIKEMLKEIDWELSDDEIEELRNYYKFDCIMFSLLSEFEEQDVVDALFDEWDPKNSNGAIDE